MNDIRVIRDYQEAVNLLTKYGVAVTSTRALLSAEKYAQEGALILFENFNTAAELVAFARDYSRREGE